MTTARNRLDLVVRVAAVVLASSVLGGSSCGPGDAGLDVSVPVLFEVSVRVPPTPKVALDLRLDAKDAGALAVAPIIQGDQGRFRIPTPFIDNETREYFHCLAGPADVVDRATGRVVVAIAADTCLGRGPLVLSPSEPPVYEALPELYSPDEGRPAEIVDLTGVLAVNVDGCATIDGVRVRWPVGTTIDETGTVKLNDGRTFPNGSTITVETRGGTAPVDPLNNPCPGDSALLVDG